jgi:hypothetical protein
LIRESTQSHQHYHRTHQEPHNDTTHSEPATHTATETASCLSRFDSTTAQQGLAEPAVLPVSEKTRSCWSWRQLLFLRLSTPSTCCCPCSLRSLITPWHIHTMHTQPRDRGLLLPYTSLPNTPPYEYIQGLTKGHTKKGSSMSFYTQTTTKTKVSLDACLWL